MAGKNDARHIRIDLAHTWAIAGFGKDWMASVLVFLAVHCSCFGRGNLDVKLELAYGSFREWLRSTGKVSSISDFSKSELKITLGLGTSDSFCNLRLQDYPRGLGKGSDTGRLGGWYDTVLAGLRPENVPAPSP